MAPAAVGGRAPVMSRGVWVSREVSVAGGGKRVWPGWLLVIALGPGGRRCSC
jgi:hypothetical protein